jgi:hypothetical protein
LLIFCLTSYGCSAAHVPIIKPLTANDRAKVSPLPELERWIAGMVSRWATVWVTSKKANGWCSSYFIGSSFHNNVTTRYINMDYIFFCCLRLLDLKKLLQFVISYDICCQWYKHLWERMLKYSFELHINYWEQLWTFLVPKFHLPAHVMKCQTAFSFNFNRGVGRTEGESLERGWSDANNAAGSTSEMGPGHRRDVMDDHFGDSNWKKTMKMGLSSDF